MGGVYGRGLVTFYSGGDKRMTECIGGGACRKKCDYVRKEEVRRERERETEREREREEASRGEESWKGHWMAQLRENWGFFLVSGRRLKGDLGANWLRKSS